LRFTGEVLELVEQAGLENRCTFTGTEGSNPSLSARKGVLRVAAAWHALGFDRASWKKVKRVERCWSGRTGMIGNHVYLYGYRGFESLPLRHLKVDNRGV
jgi:hypothetical protein